MKEKSNFRKGLERVLASGIIFVGGLVGSANASTGRLETMNYINDTNYQNYFHTAVHRTDADEGKDVYDFEYDSSKRNWFTFNKGSKIVSKIPSYELQSDARPLDSTTPVDLELSLASKTGLPITVDPNTQNDLKFTIDLNYTFGTQPITYWERDSNDVYHIIANVRKQSLQHKAVPLDPLNGTYGSEETYLYAQIRFDKYDTDLDEDGITNFKDYAIFANNWKRTGIIDANRADPNDKGAWADFNLDNKVDANDLDIFCDNWLKE